MTRKRVLILLAFLMVMAAAVFRFVPPRFDPDQLVAASELGNRQFSVPVQEVVSPQYHIKAYLLEDKSNPIISLSFVFAHAGATVEKDGEAGLAKISAAMIGEAAGNWDSQAFKEKKEDYAISISYSADDDDLSGQMLTIKEFAPVALRMLKATLMEPRLDDADLQRIKKQAIAALQRQNENPQQKLGLIAKREIFGTHPYGRNPFGKQEDIERLTANDIRQFVTTNLGRDNLFVGIAGDITAEEAGKLLDDVFGGLPAKGAVDAVSVVETDFSQGAVYENEDWPQSISFIAAAGTRRKAVDFYPLYIANYILGGAGLNSRLNLSAREKEGLTYGIYTGLSISDKAALITGGFSATPQNFARVAEIFVEEWNKMGSQGISEKELLEAKRYLTASYNLRFADITAISEMLVYMQKEDLGIDFLQQRNRYVSEVTAEQVNRAAARYFTPDNLRMINLGKFN